MGNPSLPWSGNGSPCGNLGYQRRRTNPVNITFPELADCRECDMCGGCETHEGCLTDLNHLDWFMQFASPGETSCGLEGVDSTGQRIICARPEGHPRFHMARTGDGWKP